MTIRHITTDMRGLQRWMRTHPRKRTDGFFTFEGKELSHSQVKAIVDYAVKKGYKTKADIPSEEVARIIKPRQVPRECVLDFDESEEGER